MIGLKKSTKDVIDDKAVSRAAKREEKKAHRSKYKVYIMLGVIVAALLIGGIGGFMLDNHNHQKRDYDKAVEFTIAGEFDKAEILLDDVKYKDGQKLYAYTQMRANLNDYNGRMNKMLSQMKALEGLEVSEINAQYNDFVGDIQQVGKLQRSINKINVDKLKVADKKRIEELNKRADTLKGKYSKMLNDDKLKDANNKIKILEEGIEKLKNYKPKRTETD